MPIQTRIKFKDFLKAIAFIVTTKGVCCQLTNKSGSARRIEFFKKTTDTVPYAMFVCHEAKYLFSEDLKKCCQKLEISVADFQEVVDNL